MTSQSYFITVNEAIKKGKLNLKYIPLALIYSTSAVYAVFFFNTIFSLHLPGIDRHYDYPARFFVIPLAGFAAAIIWRLLHSAAWKIWALENVTDVHRLYQIAINEGMIFKRDSWVNSFEFKTREQKQQLLELEARFEAPRQMEKIEMAEMFGDQEFPYSPKSLLLQLGGIFGFLGIAYFFTGGEVFFPVVVGSIFIGVTLFRWLPRIGKPAPIRFNKSTLTIQDNPPVKWCDIKNIYIVTRKRGKSSIDVLVIETTESAENLELETADVKGSNAEIERILYENWVKGK